MGTGSPVQPVLLFVYSITHQNSLSLQFRPELLNLNDDGLNNSKAAIHQYALHRDVQSAPFAHDSLEEFHPRAVSTHHVNRWQINSWFLYGAVIGVHGLH